MIVRELIQYTNLPLKNHKTNSPTIAAGIANTAVVEVETCNEDQLVCFFRCDIIVDRDTKLLPHKSHP